MCSGPSGRTWAGPVFPPLQSLVCPDEDVNFFLFYIGSKHFNYLFSMRDQEGLPEAAGISLGRQIKTQFRLRF